MNDELILNLVKTLNRKNFAPEKTRNNFEYFTVEPIYWISKPYQLIVVICLTDDYIGVINAFRANEVVYV